MYIIIYISVCAMILTETKTYIYQPSYHLSHLKEITLMYSIFKVHRKISF